MIAAIQKLKDFLQKIFKKTHKQTIEKLKKFGNQDE
jgi:hypothetical protein